MPWGQAWSSILGAYCTKDKCEKLGDCYYHEELPAIAGGTGVGMCNPIYPPGGANSACTQCGGGGDAIWNLCSRAECYSQGDCQFQKASVWTKWGTFMWFWPGMALSERTSLTIPECITTTAICAATCPSGACTIPACFIPANSNLIKCLGDRTKAYALVGLGWAETEQIIPNALSALIGTVTNTLTSTLSSAVTNAVSGKTNTPATTCPSGQTLCPDKSCQTDCTGH